LIKVVDKLMKIVEQIVTVLFAVSVVLVICQVFWRYVLGDPITWSSQISRALFCWMVYLGIPCLFNNNVLMSFDLIQNRLPDRAHTCLTIFFRLLGLFFCVSWFYFSYLLCVSPTTVGKFFPGALPVIQQLPKNALYVAQPVCCVLLFIVQVSQISGLIGRLRDGKGAKA